MVHLIGPVVLQDDQAGWPYFVAGAIEGLACADEDLVFAVIINVVERYGRVPNGPEIQSFGPAIFRSVNGQAVMWRPACRIHGIKHVYKKVLDPFE